MSGGQEEQAPNPTQRPASPAKRSAATMEGVEPAQDGTQDAPPPYEPQDSRPLSIEEQIAHIQSLLLAPINDGDKGYAVAVKWFSRVMARASGANQKDFEADALEGDIGKIDNSSLVAPGAFDNPISFGATDLPFIPLRPDVERTTHYEIFTEEAWNKVIEWYGLADGQLPIVRFAHDSAPPGSNTQNIIYELSPPIFTVRKVPGAAQTTPSDAAAVNILASRTERFQAFLARAKKAAGIPLSTKVKIFKELDASKLSGDLPSTAQSDIPSPPTSRNPSPSPLTSSKLVIDNSTFSKWTVGVNIEPIDAQDHTANVKYNGSSTLEILGLIANQTLVLEEQQRGATGGEFVSEKKQKKNSQAESTSPAPSGPVTRGRTQKNGKARGTIGLTNLGNTCYMNSALQCISRVEELAVYFLHQKHKPEINTDNPLGYNGKIANAYANFLAGLYSDNTSAAFRPNGFKGALSTAQPMFSGYGQQDSQEFLSFLVDALHEDLNRIQKKPYIENPDSDDNTVHDPEAIKQLGETYRQNHCARNDSIAMDLFNGFYKNTMVCPDCEKVSVTFDPYSLLTLQLPIENTWQGKILFMPIHGKPSMFEVDVDKNTSVKALKDYFVSKIGRGLVTERLLFAEIFSHRLYRVMYDNQAISELGIEPRDINCMYELPAVPTNAAAPLKKQNTYRSIYNSSEDPLPDMDSSLAETMAVPVYHSQGSSRSSSTNLVLNPNFVTITKNEAKSYDAILERVLASIAPMTTKHLDEAKQAKSASVQQQDSDVSMRDGSEEPRLESQIQDMFELKYTQASGEMFSTGTGGLGNVQPMQNRVRQRRASTTSLASNTSGRSKDSGYSGQGQDSPENDQDTDQMVDSFRAAGRDVFSGDVQSDEEPAMSVKQNNKSVDNPTDDDDDEFYIKLGEGIVVEWQQDAYDSLFSGGRYTFDEKDVPLVEDPELQARRNKRHQRRRNGITLEDCFTETGKTEVLSQDNAWYCNRCKELRRASKTLELWTVPDILVVHLKRFSGERFRRDKVDVLVDFPIEGLDLTQRVGCKEEGKEYVYDLFAVDNHYGGLGGGHYTAYAKNFYDGKWYDYNDSSVSRQNPEGVVSTAAYLLFYRRRSSTPLGPAYLQELVLKARAADEASEDESGEGRRLGDNSSASSRLLGSSSAGAVGAGAAITETPLQGANGGGPGRGASQAAMPTNEVGDDEGVAMNDELYDDDDDDGFNVNNINKSNNNNSTAITMFGQEATWGFEGLDDDDNTFVNTPADTASDRPDAGDSDAGDRMMDSDNDHGGGAQEYGATESQERADGADEIVHEQN